MAGVLAVLAAARGFADTAPCQPLGDRQVYARCLDQQLSRARQDAGSLESQLRLHKPRRSGRTMPDAYTPPRTSAPVPTYHSGFDAQIRQTRRATQDATQARSLDLANTVRRQNRTLRQELSGLDKP